MCIQQKDRLFIQVSLMKTVRQECNFKAEQGSVNSCLSNKFSKLDVINPRLTNSQVSRVNCPLSACYLRVKSDSVPKEYSVTCRSCLFMTSESGETFSVPQDGQVRSFSKRQFLIPADKKKTKQANNISRGKNNKNVDKEHEGDSLTLLHKKFGCLFKVNYCNTSIKTIWEFQSFSKF